MGLTCSVLGHAFDETDVDRDRSEQGSEVVTVVRELEVCRRCGETRVVSENKEVTSIVEPDDEGPTGFDADPAGPPDGADSDAPPVTEDEPAETTTDDPAADDPADPADTGPEDAPLEEPQEPRDPAEEDAEILDDDTEEPERAPGEWPGDETEEPEVAAAVDLTAEPDDTDGSSAAEAAESAETETPQPAAGGIPDGDYVCPECGFGEPIEGSSLRAGDACPACQRGYLETQ